jgi:hypothetical protein
MAKKQSRIPANLQPWIDARRKFRLSHEHVQMARELGLNPSRIADDVMPAIDRHLAGEKDRTGVVAFRA